MAAGPAHMPFMGVATVVSVTAVGMAAVMAFVLFGATAAMAAAVFLLCMVAVGMSHRVFTMIQ